MMRPKAEGDDQSTASRRQWLASMSAATIIAAFSRKLVAQESPAELYEQDRIDEAIAKAIQFLVRTQRDDGAIADKGNEVAMTSLAVMSMAAIGIEPIDHGPAEQAMRKAVNFVLRPRHQTSIGYFGQYDGSRMYGHGITTLMLTEILGMCETPAENELVHDRLTEAIKLILAAQDMPKPERLRGGWRYKPTSPDSDLSVSVWQVMALRSAKNDGLDVPGQAIDKALQYLRHSYASPLLPDGTPRDPVSGFSYVPATHHPTFAMTAAGLLAMQVCGQYDSPLVKGAAKWLMQHPPRTNERFFYYGLYYYAQGMHQMGGNFAEEAGKRVPQLLLDIQHANGSWVGTGGEENNFGAVYATTLAVLSLSVRYHYLPIYQR